tara:strand:+ start:529 stop:1173 length:645 start_codon:yes stop_codon:yes gene_type:complete
MIGLYYRLRGIDTTNLDRDTRKRISNIVKISKKNIKESEKTIKNLNQLTDNLRSEILEELHTQNNIMDVYKVKLSTLQSIHSEISSIHQDLSDLSLKLRGTTKKSVKLANASTPETFTGGAGIEITNITTETGKYKTKLNDIKDRLKKINNDIKKFKDSNKALPDDDQKLLNELISKKTKNYADEAELAYNQISDVLNRIVDMNNEIRSKMFIT